MKLRLMLIALLPLSACTPVQPWEKGNFAKSHMTFEPDPLESRWVRRGYQAKEAAMGGYGIDGGGCGCN